MNAVIAEGIVKSFGPTRALRGIDLAVPAGSVCGILGPNGAGKTTTVRILSTLLRPDAGRAQVAGFDVAAEPDQVRYRIGLAGQDAAVDEKLTGRDNLRIFGRLYHLSARQAQARADELLERFGLSGAAARVVRTYSGGMRRRFDLAASLVISPEVLFLDEPTTGLDPRSRGEVWTSIRELVATGTTVLLTTQYLDEADQLADDIVVIDTGTVIASGTPRQLKSTVGGDQIDLVVRSDDDLVPAIEALRKAAGAEPQARKEDRRITVPVTGADMLSAAVRELDAAVVVIEDISLRRPTLDDVFMQLTGRQTA